MRELRNAVIAAVALTVALGLAYPLAMIAVAQVAFPARADGESRLVAREFAPDEFQARPSVTGYAAGDTFFNNQGPNQQALADQLAGLVDDYLEREGPFNPGLQAGDIPADAVTTSASGIDPDISRANAEIQAGRVAERRGIGRERVLELVREHSSRPLLGLGGERSVNVNDLNAALESG